MPKYIKNYILRCLFFKKINFYDAENLIFVIYERKKGIRISMENFNSFQDITIIPLYAAGYFLKTS